MEGGTRVARDGELPVNTGGGQLSGGRLHGFGFLHEACVQLRGEGGDRQVAGDPEVAAVGVGRGEQRDDRDARDAWHSMSTRGQTP